MMLGPAGLAAHGRPGRTCRTYNGLCHERRRAEARNQLGTAHAMLNAMGMTTFGDRARRELLATGETVRPGATVAAATAISSKAARAENCPEAAFRSPAT